MAVKKVKRKNKAQEFYCRHCGEMLPEYDFLVTHDKYLDKNGYMSVCKKSLSEIFSREYTRHGSVDIAILSMCRMFNMAYEQSAVDSAKKQMNSKGMDIDKIFGIYKAKLVIALRQKVTDGADDVDMTYRDNPQVIMGSNPDDNHEDSFTDYTELELFWGTTNHEDIEFLEREFANFKQTHATDSYAEIVLLREVCRKILQIDKDTKANLPTDASVKQLMEIMKNLAISPNQANIANTGRAMDVFGMWIKDIETLTPAEWVEDKSIYADVDDLESYFQRYIVSPLRGFVTNSREFMITDDGIVDVSFKDDN